MAKLEDFGSRWKILEEMVKSGIPAATAFGGRPNRPYQFLPEIEIKTFVQNNESPARIAQGLENFYQCT